MRTHHVHHIIELVHSKFHIAFCIIKCIFVIITLQVTYFTSCTNFHTFYIYYIIYPRLVIHRFLQGIYILIITIFRNYNTLLRIML